MYWGIERLENDKQKISQGEIQIVTNQVAEQCESAYKQEQGKVAQER